MRTAKLELTPQQMAVLYLLGITHGVVTTDGGTLHIVPLDKPQADRAIAEALESATTEDPAEIVA